MGNFKMIKLSSNTYTKLNDFIEIQRKKVKEITGLNLNNNITFDSAIELLLNSFREGKLK